MKRSHILNQKINYYKNIPFYLGCFFNLKKRDGTQVLPCDFHLIRQLMLTPSLSAEKAFYSHSFKFRTYVSWK